MPACWSAIWQLMGFLTNVLAIEVITDCGPGQRVRSELWWQRKR